MGELMRYRVTVLPESHQLAITMTVPPGAGGTALQRGQDFPLDFYSNVHGVETVI